MDHRFVRVWARISHRVEEGEILGDILRDLPAPALVAALAGCAPSDPVAANAVATELLNRLNRAPFLGACAVSFTTILLMFSLEWIYTGTPFLIEEAGPRAYMLLAFSGVVAFVSLVAFLMWRGRFPTLRARLLRWERRGY